VNYFKKGEDPPLKDDSEYPDWLWTIHEPPPTLYSLQKKAAGESNQESGELSPAEVRCRCLQVIWCTYFSIFCQEHYLVW
jgi:hypothetical protein